MVGKLKKAFATIFYEEQRSSLFYQRNNKTRVITAARNVEKHVANLIEKSGKR